MVLTDEDIMPYGKHQGERMANVPPDYLIWLYENNKCGRDVRQYIEDNLEVIREEVKRKSKR